MDMDYGQEIILPLTPDGRVDIAAIPAAELEIILNRLRQAEAECMRILANKITPEGFTLPDTIASELGDPTGQRAE